MVTFSFYALTIIAVVMILSLLRNHPKPGYLMSGYLLVILIWAVYLVGISEAGLLHDFSLPPRVPLFIVIPALITIWILTGLAEMQKVIQKTPLFLPVILQSFRVLVELLIYATFLEGIFPQRATFEGLNFDILVGISAIAVGFATRRGSIGLKGLMLWNVLSIGILALTVYAFVSAYYFTDLTLTAEAKKFIEFPYLLLASCLLPTAIFLHVFSIRQILFKLKNKLNPVQS